MTKKRSSQGVIIILAACPLAGLSPPPPHSAISASQGVTAAPLTTAALSSLLTSLQTKPFYSTVWSHSPGRGAYEWDVKPPGGMGRPGFTPVQSLPSGILLTEYTRILLTVVRTVTVATVSTLQALTAVGWRSPTTSDKIDESFSLHALLALSAVHNPTAF